MAKKCEGPDSRDSQPHIFICQFLEPDNSITDNICYEDIFSYNVQKQAKVMRIMLQKFRARNNILASDKQEVPADESIQYSASRQQGFIN